MSVNGEEKPLLKGEQTKIPFRFTNKYAILICIGLSFIGCVIASGPLAAVPTIEELLVQNGVFNNSNQQNLLNNLFLISLGVPAVSLFGTGILYDRQGANWCACVGAFFVVVGFVISGIAIKFAKLNYLLFFAYPWLYFWGNLNSYGIYAFTVFFPNSQSFVIGLSNSSFQVSGLMAYLFKAMADRGVPVWGGHLIFGFLYIIESSNYSGLFSFIVLPILLFSVPFKSHVLLQTSILTGSTDAEPSTTPLSLLKRVIKQFAKNKIANSLWFAYGSFLYIFVFLYIGLFYYFQILLIGNTEGNRISELSALISSAIGSVGSPLLGIMCDKIGLRFFIALQNLCFAALFVTLFFPSFGAQIAGLILLNFGFSMFLISVPRWSLSFAGTKLFGSFFGFQFSLSGVAQLVVTNSLPYILVKFIPATNIWYYWGPFIVTMILTLLFGVAVCIYIFIHPPPIIGNEIEEM